MKAKQSLALQTILVAIIIIVAIIYILFIKPNYYKFNGGKIYFEPIYSESFASQNAYEIYTYDNYLYFCSQNGFKKLTKERASIWDKSFYLENPRLYTENKYMAVVDMGGRDAYVFNDKGLLTHIKVEMPIVIADISKEGILTLCQENNGKHLIQIYNQKGELAVERGTSYLADGYPIGIDLSATGEKMVTSYLSMNEGVLKSNISFFNFGKDGDKNPENILGGFILENEVAPEIKFLGDENVAVISDGGISFYNIKEAPKLIKKVELNNKIEFTASFNRGIILYLGELLEVSKDDLSNHIVIYNAEGKLLDKYEAADDIKGLVGAENNYYVITQKTIQYHKLKKKIWESDLGKEATNILKIDKNKFLIVFRQGYEILNIKDI